jgi:DNA-binding response OmpR family regulator
MKVLIISVNTRVIKEITMCLELRYKNTEVIEAKQGFVGIKVAVKEIPDLVIIDLPLPDLSNIDIIKRIREVSDAGTIFLSEKQSEIERAELLEGGADDYALKPLEHMEFLAQVYALLRRTKALGFNHPRILTLRDGISIDSDTREVYSNGKTSRLTPTEYNLLMVLLKNNSDVLTNEMILEKVWGGQDSVNNDSIKRCVHRLRSKIEIDLQNPKVILNKRGIGYQIVKSTL